MSEELQVVFEPLSDVRGTDPTRYIYKGVEEKPGNWTNLYVSLFKKIYVEYKDRIGINVSFGSSNIEDARIDFGEKDRIVQRDGTEIVQKTEIADGLYLMTKLGANGFLLKIKNILKLCGIDYSEVEIYYMSKNSYDNNKASSTGLAEFERNIILCGPPGTGKTYSTVLYATAICEGKTLEELKKEEYPKVLERYRELVSEDRIRFTTFHQSYSYEEFIEGIRPVIKKDEDNSYSRYEESVEGIGPAIDDKENSSIRYEIHDGIFKEFCDFSRSSTVNRKGLKVEIPDIPENSTVWKVNVYNDVLEQCYNDDVIRIGYDSDTKGAKLFVRDIHVGDIVLVTTRESLIYFVGICVVVSEAYRMDNEPNNKTARKVVWLAKNLNLDIRDYNDSVEFRRGTALRVPRVAAESAINLAKEHNPALSSLDLEVKEDFSEPYVFIIDEINRGNISKIFGELITLIEDSKRDGCPEKASAVLPYSGDSFSVPKNVYILGTMNTADRSIALMDTALRRRFRFVEMMPDTALLEGVKVGDIDIRKMLEIMNDRITVLLDRDHTLGHAFFLGLPRRALGIAENTFEMTENAPNMAEEAPDLAENTSDITVEIPRTEEHIPGIAMLASIFEKTIIPLLQEYFYDDYQKIQLVLGDNGKSQKKYMFIQDIKLSKVFKGNTGEYDIYPVKYEINRQALYYQQSYIEIYDE